MDNFIFLQGVDYQSNKTIRISFDGVINGELMRSKSHTSVTTLIDFEKNIIIADELELKIIKTFGEFNVLSKEAGLTDNYNEHS